MEMKKIIEEMPKVELHDHLDGGLRAETIIELAEEQKITIPSNNPQELESWFHRGANRKSLNLYLEGFSVTVSLMQDKKSLKRIAKEAIIDRAKQNIVYTEIRFAPSLCTQKGLNKREVIEAVLEGLKEGCAATGTAYGLILCAMRSKKDSLEIAKLAVEYRSKGVVAFDIAGNEFGNPPKKHLEAFQYIHKNNFHITIHAGEAFGLESIWQAIQICGAHRIGHATRLIDDMTVSDSKIVKMGTLSHFIKNRRIPLEICLSSNVQTGAAQSIKSHPFKIFYNNGFRVFLCSDNILMSNTSLIKEFTLASEAFDLTIKDFEKLAINAMKSAFINHDEKLDIIYDIIKPEFSRLKDNEI